MVRVQTPASLKPCQIDFDEVSDRSQKGSIHFHPSTTVEMTDAEWSHLQEHHADLAGKLTLVHQMAVESVGKAPEVAPKAEEATKEAEQGPSTKELEVAPPEGKASEKERKGRFSRRRNR